MSVSVFSAASGSDVAPENLKRILGPKSKEFEYWNAQ